MTIVRKTPAHSITFQASLCWRLKTCAYLSFTMTVRRCPGCGSELEPRTTDSQNVSKETSNDDANTQPSGWNTALRTATYVGGGVAAVAGGLTIAGFAPAGIAAGSLAALWQSSIGNVVAGSLFATLQSAGATGAIATTAYAGAGVAGTAATADYLKNRKGKDADKDESSNQKKNGSSKGDDKEHNDNDDDDDTTVQDDEDDEDDLVCPQCNSQIPSQ